MTTRIQTRIIAAAASPGRARFHGNSSGGGPAVSDRTASITLATKPDDGTISTDLDFDRTCSRGSSLLMVLLPQTRKRLEFPAQDLAPSRQSGLNCTFGQTQTLCCHWDIFFMKVKQSRLISGR